LRLCNLGNSTDVIQYSFWKEGSSLRYAFQAIFGHILDEKYADNKVDDIKFLLKNPPNKLNIYSNSLVNLIKKSLTLFAETDYPRTQKGFLGNIFEGLPMLEDPVS